MISLFVDSLAEYSGRNTVCLGAGVKLQAANKSVGFFKPLGIFPTHVDGVLTDEDMVFFKENSDTKPTTLEQLFQQITTRKLLYSSNSIDITDEVLIKLNEDYKTNK